MGSDQAAAEMTQNVDLAIAFFGGMLAFFSPCFLPLVPLYLVYITGLSLEEVKKIHLMTIVHSLLFILGFTIVFTSLGVAAGLAGQFFQNFSGVLRIVGGVLMILLGLYLMRILRLPFLDLERKVTISSRPTGLVGTVIVGMVFALGWTPCIGPILAGILIYAAQSSTVWQGTLMLIAFSLGLGVPLFLFSLAVNFSISLIKRIEKYLGMIQYVCGIFLVMIGLLLVTDYFGIFTRWLMRLIGEGGI